MAIGKLYLIGKNVWSALIIRSSHAAFFRFEYARVPGWTALCPLPRSILPVLVPSWLPVQPGKLVPDEVPDKMLDPACCHDWLWWRKYFTVHCISWLVRLTSSLHLRSWARTQSQWTHWTVGWSVIYHLESSAYSHLDYCQCQYLDRHQSNWFAPLTIPSNDCQLFARSRKAWAVWTQVHLDSQ